ncbi:sigma-70 family RNA polymerase sigma factor [Clostridium fungisolvens]|uniref:ECF RNA polymerase sigma factor SigX n=1 Tax=Clostridium fungisolvens TaxID=1604897 RepID=A0A6V8SPF1_9CLOT|nr:sigma-70 family RNA polymerase sigma factor [Clostridium fungisolvens]GFP78495.1 ECF RNA polymerase sigma factor SigX [Clostridium fungisolvens]
MNFETADYIAEIRQKNEKAMEFVIGKYSKLLYKVVYTVLGQFKDDGYIEECLSDIFLSIWNNSDKFIGDKDKFKSWICAIAKYKAIDYSRKRIRTAQVGNIEEIFIASNESVEEEYLMKEYKDKLLELIEKMEEPYRSIFIKRYFLGDSSDEISKDLGLTRSNVNTHLSRGRKVLREKLKLALGEVL